MEFAETESEAIAQHLERLYEELHTSDNLRTIPGVGQHTALIFLATVGDPSRFRSQSAFANYTGVRASGQAIIQYRSQGIEDDQGRARHHEMGSLSSKPDRAPM